MKFRWNGNGVELIGNTPAADDRRDGRTVAAASHARNAVASSNDDVGVGPTYSGSVFVADDRVIYSASDLAAAARCEYALLRSFDAKLGRGAAVASKTNCSARTAELGDEHEQRHLDESARDYGDDDGRRHRQARLHRRGSDAPRPTQTARGGRARAPR